MHVTEEGLSVLDLPGFNDPDMDDEIWVDKLTEGIKKYKDDPRFAFSTVCFVNDAAKTRVDADTCIMAALMKAICSLAPDFKFASFEAVQLATKEKLNAESVHSILLTLGYKRNSNKGWTKSDVTRAIQFVKLWNKRHPQNKWKLIKK